MSTVLYDFVLQSYVPLGKQFSQAMEVQGKATKTIEHYVNAMKNFSEFIDVPPLQATMNHIRAFLYHLLRERKYAPRTYNQYMYGIIAFYEIFKPDVPIRTICCRHKTDRRMITVLDRSEIDMMVEATNNIKHKALIHVIYGSGIRVNECVQLTFPDIERKSMLLKIHGKGGNERYTIFSHLALSTIVEYYKKSKPSTYLFEGRNNKPLTTHMVEIAVSNAASKAGIKKK